MATSWNSIVPALNPTPAPITCGKKDIEYGNSLLADYLSEAIEKCSPSFFRRVILPAVMTVQATIKQWRRPLAVIFAIYQFYIRF
jgi:hypothetical protein